MNLRLEIAASYIKELNDLKVDRWEEVFESNASSPDYQCCPVRFSLLHPKFYGTNNIVASCPIRGSRQFSFADRSLQGHCQSLGLWGYDCPQLDASLEADHVFPFAFGGPTRADNKAYLCSFHNRCKGSDFHAFPWEHPEPQWLQSTLENIANLRRSLHL